jgi:hypothetical protein
MFKPPHSVGKQTFVLSADSESLALTLRHRLGELNRRRLLPIIERVLGELDVPGRQIRIERLEVDLGLLTPARFEEETPERFYRELRRALEEALSGLGDEPSGGAASRTEAASRLELLEQYLVRGTLPFWAARSSDASLESLVLELAASDPEGLVTLVRRLGRRTRVLERIVLRFGESLLRRLLQLLSPEHAALILAYTLDLRTVHRVEPVLPLSDAQFSRLVWLLVLSYLVRDAGSQFNRKSFTRSLLEGMAENEGLSYAELIRTIHHGLLKTGKSRPIKSSLPAVLRELIRELEPADAPRVMEPARRDARRSRSHTGAGGSDDAARDEVAAEENSTGPATSDEATAEESLTGLASFDETASGAGARATHAESTDVPGPEAAPTADTNPGLALLEQYLSGRERFAGGVPSGEELAELRGLFRRPGARDAARAVRLIRRAARRPVPSRAGIVERLLRVFTLSELLAALAPGWGQDLAQLSELLIAVLARDAATAPAGRERASRAAVLESVLHDSWKGANPAELLRRVLETAAARACVSPSSLKKSLADELGRAGESRGVSDSGSVGERGRAAWRFGDSFARALEEFRQGLPEAGGARRNFSEQDFSRQDSFRQDFSRQVSSRQYFSPQVFSRYEVLEALHYYLRYGLLPWGAVLRDAGLTVEGAFSSLPELPSALLRALLTRANPEEQLRAVLNVVRSLDADGLARLLQRLLPQADGADGPLRASISTFASEAADRQLFYARLVSALLDGRPLDLEELSAPGTAPAAGDEDVAPPEAAHLLKSAAGAHLLKSALADRLRFGDAPDAGTRPTDLRATAAQSTVAQLTTAELLQTLATEHPEEARHFLGAVGRVDGLRAALVRRSRPPESDLVLRLLHGRGADTLDALARSFARIPAPYRLRSGEEVRLAIFDEALRTPRGELLTESFFGRVLRRLFELPLSEHVGKALLREAGAWAGREGLPAEHAAAFTAALHEAAAGGASTAGEPGEAVAGPASSSDVSASRSDAAAREEVFAFLLGESRVSKIRDDDARPGPGETRTEALPRDALLHELEVMLEESPREVCDFISQHLGDRLRRESWVRLLPESTLVRLSYLLEPRKHHALLDAAEVLGSAWSEVAPPGHPSLAGREVLWDFLLTFLASNAEPNRSTVRLVAAFFRYLAARYLTAAPGASDGLSVGTNMLDHAERQARAAGRHGLLTLLRNDGAHLLAPWESSASSAPIRPRGQEAAPPRRRPEPARRDPGARPGRARAAFGMDGAGEEPEAEETLYIDNAGLVLTGPFIPRLFESLDLLGTDEKGVPRMRDRDAASRGVHLLQYLVDGRTDAPEPQLVLNKILCGLVTGTPVAGEVELTDLERETCGRLLKSMIANWKAIENTSVAGLQETFLRREGRLERTGAGWKLKVQRKTLDVLVDQIPWSISVLRQRWMPQPLYVTW